TLTITDPNGDREYVIYQNVLDVPDDGGDVPADNRLEGGSGLAECNTFYLDKKAMATAAFNLANATIYHWAKDDSASPSSIICSGVLASMKPPLENRIWFAYPGQDSAHPSFRS